MGLPPDADGIGNYAFFDAANYAANLGRNYAELCSDCGIMPNCALTYKTPNSTTSTHTMVDPVDASTHTSTHTMVDLGARARARTLH